MSETKTETKTFVVARAGRTVDGRELSAQVLREIAETYNPQLYTANIWTERLHSMSPDENKACRANFCSRPYGVLSHE